VRPVRTLVSWLTLRPIWSTLTWLVHSNLFISLSTVSVAITTAILAGFPLEALPLFIVFAATMFVYTVNRFTDLAEDEQNVPRRAAFTRRYGRRFLVAAVFLYVSAVAVAVAVGVPGASYLVLPLVVVAGYSVGGLKELFFVKNVVVGLAWGAIPLGVGYYYGDPWRLEVLFLTGYVGTMITVAAVIFDIKDIEGDREEEIPTVPNVFGPSLTRRLSQGGNVLIALAVVAVVVATSLPSTFLVVLLMNGYVMAYIPFAEPDHGPLYYGFVVDGEHVFLAAVVIALEVWIW